MTTVRNAYQRVRVGLGFDPKESRTKQSMKAECDINNIMKKYQKTGLITHFAAHAGSYDFCPETDYRESIEIIRKAEAMFADLPSSARKRFDNDPGKFLAFVQDPKNHDEMRNMGLTKSQPPSPPPPPPAPPPGVKT